MVIYLATPKLFFCSKTNRSNIWSIFMLVGQFQFYFILYYF
jgi:hypothetical protein